MRGQPETAFECPSEMGFTTLNYRAQVGDADLHSNVILDIVSDTMGLPTEKPASHRILAGRRRRGIDGGNAERRTGNRKSFDHGQIPSTGPNRRSRVLRYRYLGDGPQQLIREYYIWHVRRIYFCYLTRDAIPLLGDATIIPISGTHFECWLTASIASENALMRSRFPGGAP